MARYLSECKIFDTEVVEELKNFKSSASFFTSKKYFLFCPIKHNNNLVVYRDQAKEQHNILCRILLIYIVLS